ncbi:MAG: hypothetical protein ACPG77_11045, partial [Nannocystaceae bacterium]
MREYPAVEAMSQTKHVASTPVEAPAKTEAVPQTTNMLAQKTDGPEADDTSPENASEKLNQVASAPSLREPSRAESQPQTTADMVAELHVPAHTATWPQADFDYATLWASVLHGVADMGAFLQARYGRMLEPGAQTGVATRENLCHAIDRAGPLQLSALLETTTEGVALLSLAPYLEGDSMHVVRIEQVDASAQGLEATVVGQLGTNFIRFVDSLYMPNRGTYARGARAVFAIGGVVAALELGPADTCVSGLEGQEQVAGELPKTRFCGVVEEVEEHAFYGIPLLRYRLSLAGSQRSLSLVAHP